MARPSAPSGPEDHRLATFLARHAAREGEALAGYRRLARELPSPAFRYLARLILADEERHHEIFGDLGQTVFAFDDLRAPGMPIPHVTGVDRATDREEALARIDEFAAWERQEGEDLRRLADELEPASESTLWSLLVDLMREDTQRHLRLLAFMRERLGATSPTEHPPPEGSTRPGPERTGL